MPSVKGRYELLDVLGEGGMGVVYRALDQDLRREVAVKTIRDSLDHVVLDLFRRECAVLASLNHPNIVDIYDIGEFDDKGAKRPYFVMPLLPGAPLSNLLTGQTQRLTPERVVEIMTQALRGLQAAHEKGLIHRDLKPSNIFVLDDDSVKIIDFGVAHLLNTNSTVGLKGTLFYMAPEQLEMQTCTALSDIFAMGVVCYEILTRRRPFTGATNEELVDSIRKFIPPPVSELNPAVSSSLSQIIHAAMAKQPWHRFSTAREFAESLQKAIRNQPIERFDPGKLETRLQRAKTALAESEYEFAGEILTEMESEGHLHPEIRPLRKQIDQANRNRTIRQLLDSAERRLRDDEYQLALEKIQQIIQLDPNHPEALKLKTSIEAKRSSHQIDNWLRLASDHLDNYSFGHARQALQKLMQIKPGDTRAVQLLDSVDRKEHNYLAIKREKEQHYQAALECWRQGEVTSALSQVERLMALDREAPERSDVEKGAAYQELFNKVRSEHESLRNAYEEAKKHVEDGDFDAGLAVCDQYLEKYPHHALFQSLKLDIGEAQRQALSAFIARVDREVQGEPDLDRKVGTLEAALAKHPGETHFEQALKAVSARRGHINAIVARAQNLEERGQYAEALNQWEMLRTVYRQYPGLAYEIERLERRKNQQATADRKARIIEQADSALKAGDFASALRTLLGAQADFSDDAELMPMEKLARDGIERLVTAEGLVFDGQKLINEGQFEEGLKLLDSAYDLAERTEYVSAALLEALLNRISASVDADPQYAETLLRRALAIDGTNPQAKSLRVRIADRKREVAIHSALSRSRQHQAEGRVEKAIEEVTRALAAYPDEARLKQLRDTLEQARYESSRHEERQRDLRILKEIEQHASSNPGLSRLRELSRECSALARKYPADGSFGEACRQIEELCKAAAEPKPNIEPNREFGEVNATRMFENPGVAAPSQRAVPNSAGGAAAMLQTPVPEAEPPSLRTPPPPPRREEPLLPSPRGGPQQAPKEKKFPFKLAAIAAGALLIVAAVALTTGKKPPVRPTEHIALSPVVFKTSVPVAHLTVDGKEASFGQQSLTPGAHTAEASAEGYLPLTRTFTVGAGQSSPLAIDLDLQPAPAELRVSSDLPSGQALIDGTPADLQGGGFIKSDLAPGSHTFKIVDGGKDLVSFTFTTKPAAAATVDSPILTSRIPAVVISSFARGAVAWGSAGLKLGTDEASLKPVSSDGVSLPAVVSGSSAFLVDDGKTPRRSLSVEPSSVPTLRVLLGAQTPTGIIVVKANPADSTVVIDGVSLKPMTNGIRTMRREPKTYVIKVVHANYQDSPEQSIDLKKGDTKTLTFDLVPTVQMGTLALERFPPDTQVTVDGKEVGTTDSGGNLTVQLTPGMHSVTFHKTGYEELTSQREIKANNATALAGEVVMPRQGTVTFKTTPANARITYHRQGETQTSSTSNGRTVMLRSGTYAVTGEAESFYSKSEQFVVQPGKSMTVEMALAPEMKEKTPPICCEDKTQWSDENGWLQHTQPGFGWFNVRSGDFSLTFLKQSAKVFFKNKVKHMSWVVDHQPNGDSITYVLDEHNLHRIVKIGQHSEDTKIHHEINGDTNMRVELDITPQKIVVRSPSHAVIDEYQRPDPGAPFGKFGVQGEVALTITSLK